MKRLTHLEISLDITSYKLYYVNYEIGRTGLPRLLSLTSPRSSISPVSDQPFRNPCARCRFDFWGGHGLRWKAFLRLLQLVGGTAKNGPHAFRGPIVVGKEGASGASSFQSKPFHLRVLPGAGAAPTGNHGKSALFTTMLLWPKSNRPPLYSTKESRISHP